MQAGRPIPPLCASPMSPPTPPRMRTRPRCCPSTPPHAAPDVAAALKETQRPGAARRGVSLTRAAAEKRPSAREKGQPWARTCGGVLLEADTSSARHPRWKQPSASEMRNAIMDGQSQRQLPEGLQRRGGGGGFIRQRGGGRGAAKCTPGCPSLPSLPVGPPTSTPRHGCGSAATSRPSAEALTSSSAAAFTQCSDP